MSTTVACISSKELVNQSRRAGRCPRSAWGLKNMYEALEAVGITTGVITNRRDFPNLGCWQGSCEWYINGEEVENSRFIYSVYEGNPNITKNDYNIYFS